MTHAEERYNAMLLSLLGFYHLAEVRRLYDQLGSATAVIEHATAIREVVPEASDRLVKLLSNVDAHRARVEAELQYMQQHDIQPLLLSDAHYPQRLKTCVDAPLMLYFKGTANLNAHRVISIVGTRHCTRYGQDVIQQFVADLRALCPETLVVSGLAYGVDICAHHQSLQAGFDTVGVLAHGLDTLYPRAHQPVAERMIRQGGLLTEFMTHTNADKVNFVRRNRIVAGMADATILVESAERGGGLITCRIANDYNRDVFAFPGRVNDAYSKGCNNLIRSNGAMLITSAAQFVDAMSWENDHALQVAKQQGIERDLFPDLSPKEEKVVEALRKQNDQQINTLSIQTNIAIGELSAHLFTLEMKGLVKAYAGGSYHLIG